VTRSLNPIAFNKTGTRSTYECIQSIYDNKKLDLISKTILKYSEDKIFLLYSGAEWSDDTLKRFLKAVS
jgi:hypothetical protein